MHPVYWLVRELPDQQRLDVRSVAIARWLLDVYRQGGWGALVRERPVHTPEGRVVHYCYIDYLDGVRDEDLVGEGGSSVEAVFSRAAKRWGWKESQCAGDDIPPNK